MLRQVSDDPESDDPTPRLVTISGETNSVVENGSTILRNMLRVELGTAVDSTTPDVWRFVYELIDPEMVSAL